MLSIPQNVIEPGLKRAERPPVTVAKEMRVEASANMYLPCSFLLKYQKRKKKKEKSVLGLSVLIIQWNKDRVVLLNKLFLL